MFRDKASEDCFFNNSIESFDNIDIKNFEDSDQIVYEVIKIINGKPLFWDEHIERIYLSFEKIGLALDIDRDLFKKGAMEIVEKDQMLNNNIKIVIGKFSDHINILIYNIKSNYPSENLKTLGVKTKAFKYQRFNPGAKVINLNYKKELASFIREENIYEAILVDDNDSITEGSRSNIFFIKNRDIYTPRSSAVLLGITRMKLVELFKSLNLNIKEADIGLDTIEVYDAAFLSGTSINALAIDSIDSCIYKSSDNETYKLIQRKFEEMLLEHTYW